MANATYTTRRSFLKVAPAAIIAASIAAPAAAAPSEKPFLHELTRPIQGYHTRTYAGDIVLIIPGMARFDNCHMLNDGRFAYVQHRLDGRIGITVPDGAPQIMSKANAEALINGRVSTVLRGDYSGWGEK